MFFENCKIKRAQIRKKCVYIQIFLISFHDQLDDETRCSLSFDHLVVVSTEFHLKHLRILTLHQQHPEALVFIAFIIVNRFMLATSQLSILQRPDMHFHRLLHQSAD